MSVLDELEMDVIRVVAVAKGRARKPGAERIFMPGSGTPLDIRPDSSALLLIQQIRDEAHRFAITGHRLVVRRQAFYGVGDPAVDQLQPVVRIVRTLMGAEAELV